MLNKCLLAILTLSLFSILEINAQVTVDFDADVREGCGSLQVSFSDQSSSTAGSITSWEWNLGGVSSNLADPGRIFGSVGSYQICLTVTDNQGNTDTKCEDDYIVIHDLPTPDFIATVNTGCIPHEVTFEDRSTSTSDIVEWIWDVGGSAGVVTQTGSAEPVTSLYTIADDYSVNLIIRDENGCESILFEPSYVIVNGEPIIDVEATETFTCSFPFSANFVNNNIEPNTEYTWNFGNGSIFTGNTPPGVVYGQQGTYTVTVVGANTITGCADTLVLPDYIHVGHPIDFEIEANIGCVNTPLAFTNTSGVAADAVTWDFGDGNTSNAANPNHSYATAGCYTVSLAIEIDGCTTTKYTSNCINIFENPTISYSIDEPAGCIFPHDVQFTGTGNSIGAITSWEWDFGDGNTSTIQNPSHTYTSYGSFPVTLTITDSNGCTNTIADQQVEVQELRASIPFDLLNGCTPLGVSLTDNSNSVLPLTNWNWTVFESGSSPMNVIHNSTAQNPTFAIQDTGVYDIILEVTSVGGCVDRDTFEQRVEAGMPPVISFDANPRANCVNSLTAFENNTSDWADIFIWDFGDGEIAEDYEPSHEYVDTGFFDVTLISLHNGCPNELIEPDFVQILPPIAKGRVTVDCENPFDRVFDNNSIGADSIYWDFGDNSTSLDSTTFKGETTYTFPGTGSYGAMLIAYNAVTGCTDTIEHAIEITDPEAAFSINETLGCNPLTLTVNNDSEFGDTYSWTGAGAEFSNSGAAEPEIIFNDSGTFSDLVLEIEDVNGCRDTFVFADDILVNGVDVDATFSSGGGCEPFSAQFFDNSTDLFGNIITWEWNVADGLYTSTDQNPSFVMDSVGAFDVVLTVTDDIGCTGTTTFSEAVLVTKPVANFEGDSLTCTAGPVQFFNTSEGVDLVYNWDFGDGNSSSVENPIHNYATEGVYDVCLTVTDLFSCDSTICKPSFINVADPVANFTPDNTFASCPPLIVNFDNTSQNASTYEWTFGDDSGSSNTEDPAHVYSVPGSYAVTLIARSTEFCADTLIVPDMINLLGPVGEFRFDTLAGCAPLEVTFVGTSIEPYDYIWDYGNGVLDTTSNVTYDSLTYQYKQNGNYVPKLILVDAAGCHRTLESPDEISVDDILPDFQAIDSVFCNETNVSTTFINTSFSNTAITSSNWLFEGADNPNSSLIEPQVTYSVPGTYDVLLIVESASCRDSILKEDYIRIGDVPDASFTMSAPISCTNEWVDFTDQSTVVDATIDTWVWTFGDGDVATLENPNHLFQASGTYDVQLRVMSDIGCADSTSQSIDISALPTVDLTGDSGICIGNLSQLDATFTSDDTGAIYSWVSDPTLNCTDCLDPLVNPVVTTTYTFIAENSGGCIDSFEVVVEVLPYEAPVIDITPDTIVCENNIMPLSASGGETVYAYNWDSSAEGLSCYEACNNPIASPSVSTMYTVTVTNDVGCYSIDSVNVDVINQAQEFAGLDRVICESDTVHLEVSTGTNPNWIIAEGLSCAYCPDPIASPAITTAYIVEVTSDEGCPIIDTVNVEIVHPEDVDAGVDIVACLGEEIFLEGVGQGEASWTPALNIQDADNLLASTTPQSSGVYYLTMTYGDCILSDSVNVDVLEKTVIEGIDETICEGDSLYLSLDGEADNFVWFGPETATPISNEISPEVHPVETSVYTVIAQNATCEPDTAYVTVEVNPAPEVYLTRLYEFFPGQAVKVEVETEEFGYNYYWDQATELSCLDCPNPNAISDSTKTFKVEIVNEVTGCTTERETILRRLESCPNEIISMANIFSPNGDGENDFFEIYTSAVEEIESFSIFNRWGALVFESDDINAKWDGRFKNQNVPAGVYIYMIELRCELTGDLMIIKGDVSIIR